MNNATKNGGNEMTISEIPTTPNTTEQLEEENWILYLMDNKLWSVLHPDTTADEIAESDSIPVIDCRVTSIKDLV